MSNSVLLDDKKSLPFSSSFSLADTSPCGSIASTRSCISSTTTTRESICSESMTSLEFWYKNDQSADQQDLILEAAERFIAEQSTGQRYRRKGMVGKWIKVRGFFQLSRAIRQKELSEDVHHSEDDDTISSTNVDDDGSDPSDDVLSDVETRPDYTTHNTFTNKMQIIIELSTKDVECMMKYAELGRKACMDARQIVDSTECWTVIDKGEIKAFRKDPLGLPMLVKGTINLGKTYTVNEVINYLWDPEIAAEYDHSLIKACAIREFPSNLYILYQAFKGRFGLCGRDFVMYSVKHWESKNRVTIGSRSVESWPNCDHMVNGLVRGFTHLGGYDVRKDTTTEEILLTLIFQVNIKTDGIPAWIVNRVKLEQLQVAKHIRKYLRERYAK